MWFIASVAWAAESNNLQDDLESFSTCANVQYVDRETHNADYQTFVQANISIVSCCLLQSYCLLLFYSGVWFLEHICLGLSHLVGID